MRLRESFSRTEVAFVVGVPLAWAVLLLFHPTGDEIVPTVRDNVTPWLVVHIGTLVMIPLLAATLFVVLRHFEGPAAAVARAALVVFAIFYSAFETIGSLAWLVAVAAAGVAMFRRAQTASSIAVVILFVISAPGVVFHVPPFGQVGLALFVLALLLALRERPPVTAEEPLVAA